MISELSFRLHHNLKTVSSLQHFRLTLFRPIYFSSLPFFTFFSLSHLPVYVYRSDIRQRGRTLFLYSNIYPTRCNVTQFILSGKCSTCFGWYLHLSSGAHKTPTVCVCSLYSFYEPVFFLMMTDVKSRNM